MTQQRLSKANGARVGIGREQLLSEPASQRLLSLLRRRLNLRSNFAEMTEDSPIDEISEIEARIEALAEIAERCRKFILASKIAIGGGGVLLLVTILGLFGLGQAAALGSIALVLGGIVSLGSNVSTLQQTDRAISVAEARRAQLIGAIDLRLVRDTPMKLM